MRQSRGNPDPAHFALGPHILKRRDKLPCLALSHSGIVQLHDVHVVCAQPFQALVQTPE